MNAATCLCQVRQRLEEVGLDPEEAAPYPLHLLGITAGTERVTALSPEEYKARTFVRLRQFSLLRSRQQPLIMAVENLHWIDATLEDYLTSLVEPLAGAPILLLATYRPGYRPPWLGKSYATQLALPGLTARDSLVVVQSVLQTMPLSDALQQEIVGKAAGNPFFLEELTRAVVAEGARPPTLVVPDTVQAVLAACMDQLPPEEKRLLQTAAVIGMDVSVPLLQAVVELPEDALSRGLAHLQAAEFLYETRLFPDHAYTFTHALTREVAYETLLQERRRALHARIVEVIEALAGDRVAEQVERLAYNALRGEVWDNALAYGQQAGEKAMTRSAYREAVEAFEQALKALEHLPEQRALALATAGGDAVLEARANRSLGIAYQAQGNYRRAIDCFGQTVVSLDGAQSRDGLGQVILPAVLCRAWLATCHAELGAFAEAVVLGEEGLQMAEAAAHPGSLIFASWGLGLPVLRQGNLARALPLLERAVGLCREAGRVVWFPETAASLGAAYSLDGRVADAVALLRQAMEQITAMESVEGQVQCHLALGEAQALAGRLEEAHALGESALVLANRYQERGYQAYALRLLVQIAARREPPKPDQAKDYYRQALILADELGMRPLQAHCHLGLGQLFATSGRHGEARAEFSIAIEL